jgi:adenylate kinase family enzyme
MSQAGHETPKRIHILGASGSGTSTLAEGLAQRLGYAHLDTDDHYWMKTDPPYLEARPREERQAMLAQSIASLDAWILSGSLCGWGDFLMDQFDLVIFVSVPAEIRMARLWEREVERYGITRISPGGDLHEKQIAFLRWAEGYDTAGLEMRSRVLHENWLRNLPCQVLRIEGVQTQSERIELALSAII